MVTRKPVAYRRGQRILKGPDGPPPVPALTLVSVTFDGSASLFLQFDRAVDLAGADVGAMVVRCVDNESTFAGTGAAILVDPVTVQIDCAYVDVYLGDGVLLDAGADNGIVALGDGAAWGGCGDLELPFG